MLPSAILLIPHTGGSDAIILETALRRRIFYFAQKRFFSSPLANWFFERLCDCLPISFSFNPADIASLRQGLRLVENGEILGIFLEMDKDNSRHFLAPLDIAAYLSLPSNSPIFPVTIANIHQRPSRFTLFNRTALGETIYTLVKNFFREVTVTIDKPVYLKASHFSKSRNKLRSKLGLLKFCYNLIHSGAGGMR